MYTLSLHIQLIRTRHGTRVPIPKLYTTKCILYIIYILRRTQLDHSKRTIRIQKTTTEQT
jgi:hypothetical protein